MKSKPGNKRLKKLMKKHRLKMKDVAERLHVVKETVKSWRRREGSSGYRNMPQAYLDLLKIYYGESPEYKPVTRRTKNRTIN